MGYGVAGGYYRGDYYRGDFLGGLLGAVGGFITGGPAGAIIGGVSGLLRPKAHPSIPPPAYIPPVPGFGGGLIQPHTTDQFGIINVGGQGKQTGIINLGGGPGEQPPSFPMAGGPSLPGTKGYHANKSTYETRGGGTSRWGGSGTLQIHPKGSTLVKNRRMNVGNSRALKRALRRAGGFARLARRVMSFTHPRAGRGHFKIRRRAKR